MNDLASAGCLWIAIASYDPRFSRICQNYIGSLDHNAFHCDLYQSGEELLAALQNGLPYRAVLMDNAMSDMDASEFCSRLRQMEPRFRPWLLLVPTCSVDELNSIIRSQDPACPQEPGIRRIQMAGLNSLLFDLDSMLRAQSAQNDSDAALIQLLLQWGEHPGSLGAQYLRECIQLALRCEPHFAVRKDVLLPVGERHSVTVAAVDSGIRRLLDNLDYLNRPAWQAFKCRHRPRSVHLTTGRFIYVVRDELLLPAQDLAQLPLSEGEPQVDEQDYLPV